MNDPHQESAEPVAEPRNPAPTTIPPAREASHGAAAETGAGKPPQRASVTLDRASVLRVTARVLEEKGFEKTTIRTISGRLGCAVGSIYRHFTDKHQLLEEVVEARFAPIAEAAEAGLPCEATTRAFLAVAAGQPEQYRLMFWLAALGRGPGEAATVPSVVRRLVAAWSAPEQLGSLEASQAHWALHHGQLMLGLHDDRCGDGPAALAALAGSPADAEADPAAALPHEAAALAPTEAATGPSA